MKSHFGALALGLLLAGTAPLYAQGVQEIAATAEKFGKMPPNMYMGEGSSVAVDSKGNVYVFSRGGSSTGPAYAETASQLLEFDKTGKYMREIGHGLYAWSFAHGVSVDKHDNIWVADKGSDMVVRFNQAAEVTLVLGRKQEASDKGTGPIARANPPLPPVNGQFRQVTGVAFDSHDNAYISDGYINSRVGIVNSDGEWMGSFGGYGSGPGQLNTVHAISSDAHDLIYVADRSNRRIQVFTTTGQVVRQITMDVPFPPDTKMVMGNQPTPDHAPPALLVPGAPWVVCVTPTNAKGVQYLYSADAYPGRVYKMTLDGKMLGYVGIGGRKLGQFGWIHGMACPSENTVFVSELLNWRVQKLTLHPTASQE